MRSSDLFERDLSSYEVNWECKELLVYLFEETIEKVGSLFVYGY